MKLFTSNLHRFQYSFSPLFFGILATSASIIVNLVKGIETTAIPDATGYIAQAKILSEGINYAFENPDLLTHGIGFSFLIALTFVLSQSTSLLIFKLILALTHGLSVYLFARIADRYITSKKLLACCVLLFTFDPFILIPSTDVQTEPITTLLTLFWLYLFLAEETKRSRQIFLTFTFAISGFYSVIMRPNSLLALLLIAFLIYRRWIQRHFNSAVLVSSVAVFVLLLGLYQIFITKLYSGFVFLTPIGGVSSAYMCRKEFIPQYLGIATREQNEQINAWSKGGGGVSEIFANNVGSSVSTVNNELFKLGKESCLSNPLESAGVLALKAAALWRPFTVFGAYSLTIFLISFLIWVPLTIVVIKFLVSSNLSKNERMLRLFFLVLSFGYTASLLLTPTQIRHRVAFAEPFYWLIFFISLPALLKLASRAKIWVLELRKQ
jgi:hypothetical protein